VNPGTFQQRTTGFGCVELAPLHQHNVMKILLMVVNLVYRTAG